MKKIIAIMLLSLKIAYADTTPLLWIQSSEISGFNQTVANVSKQDKTTVIFPKFVPYDKNWPNYFFNFTIGVMEVDYFNHNQIYNLNISTSDCHGEKSCTLVSLDVQLGNVLKRFLQGHNVSSLVVLENGFHAYYIPRHGDSDYWPPTLAWYQNGKTYILEWQGFNDNDLTRDTMIIMASTLFRASS